MKIIKLSLTDMKKQIEELKEGQKELKQELLQQKQDIIKKMDEVVGSMKSVMPPLNDSFDQYLKNIACNAGGDGIDTNLLPDESQQTPQTQQSTDNQQQQQRKQQQLQQPVTVSNSKPTTITTQSQSQQPTYNTYFPSIPQNNNTPQNTHTQLTNDTIQSFTALLQDAHQPLTQSSTYTPHPQQQFNRQAHGTSAHTFNTPANSMQSYAPQPQQPLNEEIMDPKWNVVKSESDSRANFAWKILQKLFTEQQLIGKNCSGRCPTPGVTKEALSKDAKITILHDIVFWGLNVNPGESKSDAWKSCKVAIDTGLRRKAAKNK